MKGKKGILKKASIESVANYIKDNEVSKIIVMTGAGISTSAGIPDFRSKDTGLYHNLQKFNLPYAEAVFDIDYFEDTPEPFYALAKELYPGKFLPTKTHYFIQLLQKKGLLLRNFTQNIDTLERMAGLDAEYIVEAHGSFATASCVDCEEQADPEMVKKHALEGKVPHCDSCQGLIKPDIVFFGENLPKRFFDRIKDFKEADLLIVIGTSLQVQPFASLIDEVPETVPRLLINREMVGEHRGSKEGFDFRWKHGLNRDVAYLGGCDDGVEKLADLLGWKKELDTLYKEGTKKIRSTWAAKKGTEEDKDEVDELTDILQELTTDDTVKKKN